MVSVGQTVTFTVTLPNASVTAEFFDGQQAINGCTDVSASKGSPVATCTVLYSVVGSHSVSAVVGVQSSNAVSVTVQAQLPTPYFAGVRSAVGRVGSPLSINIQAVGEPTPRLSIVLNGTGGGSGHVGLPPGVRFTDKGSGSAILSGIPKGKGTYHFDIRAKNANGTATEKFTLAIGSSAG